MTAFNPETDLPAGVNTVERLFLWVGGILYDLHKNSKYQESDGSPLVPIITAQDGLAADGSERVILRHSQKVSDGWRTSTSPFYLEAVELTNAPIPPEFLP